MQTFERRKMKTLPLLLLLIVGCSERDARDEFQRGIDLGMRGNHILHNKRIVADLLATPELDSLYSLAGRPMITYLPFEGSDAITSHHVISINKSKPYTREEMDKILRFQFGVAWAQREVDTP